MPYLVNIGIMK